MSNDPSMLTNILKQTDNVVHHFVFNGYHSLAVKLLPTIEILTVLIVIGFGFAILRGMIQVPVQQLINISVKYGVIVYLATEWGFFSKTIYELFTNGPNELTRAIIENTSFKWSLFEAKSVNSALQEGLNQGMSKATEIIQMGSWHNLSPVIVGFLAGLAIMLISGFSVGLLVLAKAGLGICLVLAPLFLICFLFESTKNITEKWMQHVIGFALMPIGIHCVLFLVISLMDSTLSELKINQEITFATAGAYILLCIISLPLLKQVNSLMASIASGFSFQSLGAIGNSMHFSGKLASGARVLHKKVYGGAVGVGQRIGAGIESSTLRVSNGIMSQIRKV